MQGKKFKPSINRRQFVGTTVKLVTLGSILGPLAQSCNNKKKSTPENKGPDSGNRKTKASHSKKKRQKWNRNALVINTKTNVLHYPTPLIYTYYDEIKASHLGVIDRMAWNPGSEVAGRLNKQQSGKILEILALQDLQKEVNDSTLASATETLSLAFQNNYQKANILNFRLHELMLQLVTLNNSIPADQKWAAFNSKSKKPEQLRKRQKWMETESNFTERVNYILNRKNEYITRLQKRASRFTYT